MSTRARGRGAFERGGRGTNTRGRTLTTRGSFNGTSHNSQLNGGNDGATTTTSTFARRGPRADRGQRGGAFGSGANTRGHNRARGAQINSSTNASFRAVSNSTPHPHDDYQARLQYLRDDRPRLKAQLVAEKRMNPPGQLRIEDAVTIYGICQDMCPEYERVRRIVEKDLKLPEFTPESLQSGDRNARVPDESRMVKAYARPAAGNDADLVTDIRTPTTCLKTMTYMIERLDHEDLDFLHGWLWDRTRGVRKDLRQQAVEKPEDIMIYLQCFEQNTRLLLLCLHHMARSLSEDYSHQQDLEQLRHTMLSLRERYDDNRKDKIVSPNEAEFQAYRLIAAIQTSEVRVESETQNLRHLQQNRRVQVALEILRVGKAILDRSPTVFRVAQQNWKRFWDLIKSSQTSYLMACAAEIHFSAIRDAVMKGIYRVYRQKAKVEDLKMPMLLELLGFDTKDQVRDFCGLYGFTFGTSQDGNLFLDMESSAFKYKDEIKHLDKPADLSPQIFSQSLVESKRKGRLLSAVIKGMSVSEALSRGFVAENPDLAGQIEAEPESESQDEDKDSLFVKDDSVPKPTGFTTASNLSGIVSGQSAQLPSSTLNPVANLFKPNGASATQTPVSSPFVKSNPFQTNGTGAVTHSQPNPFNPPSSGSTLFKTSGSGPSTFGLPSASTGTSAQVPEAPTPTRNIFTSSTNSNQAVKPGLFDANKNTIKFSTSSPFGTPSATAATSKPVDQPTASTLTASPFSSTLSTEKKPNGAPISFPTFPGTSISEGGFSSLSQTTGVSLASQYSATSTATTQPSNSGSSVASSSLYSESPGRAKSLKAPIEDAEKQQKIQEEEQRKQEVQDRRKREEQERQIREEEQRKARELERKAREEQERRAQEEKARLARQEQERREREQREERERQEAAQKQKEMNFQNLTNSVFLDPIQGLLAQFIEQQVRTLAPVCAEEVEREQAEQLAQDHRERKRQERIRSYCLHWYNVVVKKKNKKRARNRRRWLRDNAEKLMAMEQEQVGDSVISAEATAPRNDFKIPEVPASAGIRPVEKPAIHSKAQGKTSGANGVNGRTDKKKSMWRVRDTTLVSNRATTSGIVGLKKSYAPIDRTETDYFKLRAKGLDPSKYRKRSFDSDAEVDGAFENDRKRARTSFSSSSPKPPAVEPMPIPQQSPLNQDDLFARYEALKASMRKPALTSTPTTPKVPKLLHGSPRDVNAVIASARAMLSSDTSRRGSSAEVQHEFSRSVPDLTSQQYGADRLLVASTAIPPPSDKPAYWGRVSRFVPRSLYGKGLHAVRDFIGSRGTGSTASSITNPDPLDLSSPIQSQHSYVPITQDVDYANGESDVELEHEEMSEQEENDEDMVEQEDDEDDELDEEEELAEHEESEAEYSEEGYEDDEEGEEEHYGYGMQYEQEPQMQSGHGATQDDAIELSD